MKNIDWFYLSRPLIMFAGSIILTAVLIVSGLQFEKVLFNDYETSVSTLRSTFSIYRNIINDIDLLEQYRSKYNGYKASGLVGKERRLSWIESLKSTNSVLRLPTLTYSLLPQEEFDRPDLKIKRGVEVASSPMELNMGMLHEEDLFALLEGLRLSIKNLFTVDSCRINRQYGIERSLDTKKANLTSNCTIRWVTIDAE